MDNIWRMLFLLTDLINGLSVTPRMLQTSVHKSFSVMYALGVVGDAIWHQQFEQSDLSINLGASFYFAGLFPFLVRFFRGKASQKLKAAMAGLFMLNLYTFGDPKATNAPLFNHKHLANHVGSTLFFFIACNKAYQTVPMWGQLKYPTQPPSDINDMSHTKLRTKADLDNEATPTLLGGLNTIKGQN